ncbi:MAG: hypothetical protein PHI27_08580 [Eubacteriales bacterium]|nr:hypothetical protein [Eubacteriales bacterium]MDD3882294.1 hypothetical protein [Eubacteriales bacterium]MDD4512040.1 hypothetical protein [Eubacteriales bacterium]
MSFFEKIKQTLRSFMNGRYGGDQLSRALLWVGLAIYLLGLILNISILWLIGLAVYVFVIYRMMSKKLDVRAEENRKYMSWISRRKTEYRQAKARFKNRKEYKYFRCPGCKSWLKLKRGTGSVTVTCSRCRHSFEEKA